MSSVRVVCFRKGSTDYDMAKRKIISCGSALSSPVKMSYIKKLFEEEEDIVDYICMQYWGRIFNGYMLLTKKLLCDWVPPGWTWEYIGEKDPMYAHHETRYTNTQTGLVVYDNLDRVWRGRSERDSDVFSVDSLHILFVCARNRKGCHLMHAADECAIRLGIRCVSLGAANPELCKHYSQRYKYRQDCVGRFSASESLRFLESWNRAFLHTNLYGTFMSKVV